MRAKGILAFPAVVVGFLIAQPAIAVAAPPSNDDFDTATTITLPFSQTVGFPEATYASDDPVPCSDPSSRTLWYRFTPDSDGRVALVSSMAGVSIDVFVGTRGNLTRVACITHYAINELRFDATADTEYSILLNVPSGWDTDDVVVTLTAHTTPPGPSNDDFSGAAVIDDFDFADEIDADDATESLDDPLCNESYRLHRTVWYRYTPPTDTQVRLSTSGSTLEGAIAVYRGTRGDLRQVGLCQFFNYGAQPSLAFLAREGVTYHIHIGTLTTQTGTLAFSFGARIPSTLSLTSPRSRIDYGRSIRLTARLVGYESGTNPIVSIYELNGIIKTLVDAGPVNGEGRFSLVVSPKRTTKYVAEWAGDGQYDADKGSRKIAVHVVTTGRLFRFYARSGAYRLYHPGTNPLYVASVYPNLKRTEVTFVLQGHRNGSWRTMARVSFPLDQNSRAGAVVDHRALVVGGRYRIQARFPGTLELRGDAAPWAYFAVTG